MEYTISRNSQYNSTEITFNGKPSEAIRDALKALKYRWHSVRRVWYGYTDEETARQAIETANGSEDEKPTTTAKPSSKAAKTVKADKKPDQDHIRIYFNGIKMDGGKLIRCGYSLDNNATGEKSVSIYAHSCGRLPRDLLPVKNETDIYTDYFDDDHAYITDAHPLYKYFRYAAMKDRARMATKHAAQLRETLENGRERWAGQFEMYRRDLERDEMHIAEFESATDPGQPTAADLEEIIRQRQEQENAEREARHAAELAERERVLNQRCEGKRLIESTAGEYPIIDGDPVVTIEWSEHPAFYAWEDGELNLSLSAAEIILSTLDKECANIEHYGYDKTKFTIEWTDSETGEARTYQGRYDLGDNDGGLIAHIRAIGEWELGHDDFGNERKTADETNDRIQIADYFQRFTA